MIAIYSFPEDPHASRVLGHLHDAGHEALLLNLEDLPDRATLTIDYAGNGRPRIEYHPAGQPTIDLESVHTVWWRRPQAVSPSTVTDQDLLMFVGNEWHEALNGMWQLLRDRRWVNDLVLDDTASRKALQLKLAADVGLGVPKTLMTSDPTRAREFIEATGIGRTIFKTFSCTHQVWRETRLVQKEDLDNLESLRISPVIFQEYIPAGADLRITVIGPHIFPAEIRAEHTDYPVDFRMSLGQADTGVAKLPAKVEKGLRDFMDRVGLIYGAIDMRRTPDGDYVFLEINTAGEFLFVEERTGLPIAKTLADYLANPD